MHGMAIELLIGLFLSASLQIKVIDDQELRLSRFLLSQKTTFPEISEQLEEELIKGMDQGIKGNYSEAIRIFSRLIQAHPYYADAYYNRGIAKAKLADKQGAIRDYNQAIQINNNLAEAYQERGYIWLDLGNKAQAIKDFQKAAQLYQQQGNTISYSEVIKNIQSLQQP